MSSANVISFPTDFTSKAEILDGGLGIEANAALEELAERGLVVAMGFERDFLPAVQEMARQDHIKSYCHRDLTEDRFATEDSTRHWLGKGRAFFALARKQENGDLHPVGYGWGGPGTAAEVPGGETTWAVRLGEEAVGQKLSEPFSRIIVDATIHIFGADNVWLETWQSNAAGVHTYGKICFEFVMKKPGKRITADGSAVDDVRLFMKMF